MLCTMKRKRMLPVSLSFIQKDSNYNNDDDNRNNNNINKRKKKNNNNNHNNRDNNNIRNNAIITVKATSISLSSTSSTYIMEEQSIIDPRELHTILLFSLRTLFGDFEKYSCMMKVTVHNKNNNNNKQQQEELKNRNDNQKDDDDNNSTKNYTKQQKQQQEQEQQLLFDIICPIDSICAIRSALTFVSPPPYLLSNVYTIDVLDIVIIPKK